MIICILRIAPSTTAANCDPDQYGNTINYVSVKISKEIKFGNFALDNTFLYQKVSQQDAILNVPGL
jgi:hypothetical protein